MRSESSDNVEISVSLSNLPVHQSGKEHVVECRCRDPKQFVSKSTQNFRGQFRIFDDTGKNGAVINPMGFL